MSVWVWNNFMEVSEKEWALVSVFPTTTSFFKFLDNPYLDGRPKTPTTSLEKGLDLRSGICQGHAAGSSFETTRDSEPDDIAGSPANVHLGVDLTSYQT